MRYHNKSVFTLLLLLLPTLVLIDKKTRAPLSLRLKFGIIWVTVKITHFKSGGISASTFAFPKHRYHNYKVIDNR